MAPLYIFLFGPFIPLDAPVCQGPPRQRREPEEKARSTHDKNPGVLVGHKWNRRWERMGKNKRGWAEKISKIF